MYENANKIVREIAKESGLKYEDLIGFTKTKFVSDTRKRAIRVLYSEGKLSLREIGAMFGGRDRSSIHYAIHGKRSAE